MKKTTLAALLSAAAITVAGAAWAVEAQPAQPAPAPAPEAAAEQPAPMVGMSDAVAVAEKEYKAKTYRANLRNSGQYGLVWDVHMVKEDETHVRAYVDAKTGKVVAADVKGIQERRHGSRPASAVPRDGRRPGHEPRLSDGRRLPPPGLPRLPSLVTSAQAA